MVKLLDPLAPHYRIFIQQTLDAICVYDAATKQILEINQAFLDLMGYTADEAHRLKVTDLLAETPPSVTGYFQQIIVSGRSSLSERRWKRKDGAPVDVQVTASEIKDESTALVFVVARDLTDRRRSEEAVYAAEHRYRTLFDEAPVMYVITRDRDGVPLIVDCNQLFLTTLGYSHDDVIGRPISDFYTPAARAKLTEAGHARALREYFFTTDQELLTSEGRVIQTLLRTAPEVDGRGQPIGTRSMYLDVTELNKTRAELQFSERQSQVLSHLTRSAASALDIGPTLQLLADQLAELTGADATYISLWDEQNQLPMPAAAHGVLRDTYPSLSVQPGEKSLTAAVLEAGRAIVADDTTGMTHVYRHILDQYPQRSVLALPLLAGEQKLGAAIIVLARAHSFTAEDIARAEKAAGPIALVVAKARLYEELKVSHGKLQLAYDAALEGWAKALELRDKETEGHTRRVAEMTVRLARELGVPEAELVHIRRGALLHDIGKIGVPDSILNKAGPLTSEERTIMRKHPAYAFEMLSPIEFLYDAVDIPYCHHERWDGSGYPRGLREDAIPLAARIFAVVDVWDALLSDRPYRRGLPLEDVLEYMQAKSGAHFDAAVVEVFIRLWQSGAFDDSKAVTNPL